MYVLCVYIVLRVSCCVLCLFHVYSMPYVCFNSDTGVCEKELLRKTINILAFRAPNQGMERAVSAAGLQGKGLRKRIACFTDTDIDS